jgi:FdhE protein
MAPAKPALERSWSDTASRMKVSEEARRRLDAVALATPEWRPWLGLVEETLTAIADPAWERVEVRGDPRPPDGAPALARSEIVVDPAVVRAWVRRLLRAASEGGAPGAVSLPGAMDRLDPRRFLEVAVGHDLEALAALSADSGADREALTALLTLAPMPVLHALGRRLGGRVPESWSCGYCPVCGGWPILAEVRGLERAVRLRCARCGGDWRGEWLRCCFCGKADHRQLGALMSESHGETRKVETCESCRGYLKTMTTLAAWPAETVALEDLATVDLDVAALGRGYRRPERAGYPLGASLVETASKRGFFRRRR